MQKVLHKISGMFLSVMVLSTCTEPYEVELDSTYTFLVVDGMVTTDTMAHTIRLTESADYFVNEPAKPVTNASISLYDGYTTIEYTEDLQEPGIYYSPSDYYGVPGRTYNLTISDVDIDKDGIKEEYKAEDKIVHFIDADSIRVEWFLPPHSSRVDSIYFIRLFMGNPTGPDYLMFRFYKNGMLLTDTLDEVGFGDDEILDTIENVIIGFFDGEKPGENLRIGDTLILESLAMTEDSYDFFNQLNYSLLQSVAAFSIMGFNGPPANVKTNITGGRAVGWFSTFNSKKTIKKIDYIWEFKPHGY
jgi:hypothetical protein